MIANSVLKILVVSDGEDQRLGFLRLPFIRALKFAFPLAKIDWLVAAESSGLSQELSPLVAGLIESIELAPQLTKGIARFIKPPWQGKHYNLCINFLSGGANDWLAKMIPADLRYTVPEPRPDQHPTELLLALVSAITEQPSQANLQIPISRDAALLAGHILRFGYNYVAIAPGLESGGLESRGQNSQWPLDFYAEVALTQFTNNRIPIFILLGDSTERFNKLSTAVPTALFPLQHPAAAGRGYDLVVAILQQSWVGLAEDSLAGHLMAAANIPMLSLFNDQRALTRAPWAERGMVMLASDFAEEGGGRHPLSLIPPVNVLNSLEALIQI
ncbi:MAG: hypothetical protein QM523_04025 [Candidatus Pacebacteria bacterium]|nr:hypothetical protein [Candidatus Paceibacterota bacterium]